MRLVATVVVLGVVFASASGTPSAHHSFASQFDDRVAVTLHGVIASAEMINPHSFIHIDVKTPDGAMERWALEGPGPLQITRRGLALDLFKPGESLGVCGYLAKNGSAAGRRPDHADRRQTVVAQLSPAEVRSGSVRL